jgi:catalase-peroxidase
MTVLVGGLRSSAPTTATPSTACSPTAPGQLTNDFFVNLLDMGVEWEGLGGRTEFVGHDRKTGDQKWTATAVDLVFGSNSQLRASRRGLRKLGRRQG